MKTPLGNEIDRLEEKEKRFDDRIKEIIEILDDQIFQIEIEIESLRYKLEEIKTQEFKNELQSESDTTAHVSNVLFATIKRGKTGFQELLTSVGADIELPPSDDDISF